ncbi:MULTISPECIES: RNA-guided endonuclease TnpB family protein [unclassified Okeania]|uniref:RNA-guided endonuclease InsQ/TnpB family protein n=1 Tax=unclassified Okeania TaxID=2634635 RepID=UPI0013BDBF9C|nr:MULTISPECIES: RNA-guided endonuclease TnpB family protein [unclassified Okeania]NEP04466.1 IS200/IS605 family element transposase accessory protein TnpB [Okeania sp. SIO4D6]NEP40998.1 IS200/IS605 family element transposase accessory protein TnpB [Okeania sp. SIO2H7]NEP70932.1 IS200/IS605 family element transposase accessory protein TnpB [Okeania sp. SIO2G5]NEP92288.1 IS200/IS605 family element transposase accessory protein TnpB [Okeania sp. SIO2F5]NEQ89984.1 IS200/IS605 family element trans
MKARFKYRIYPTRGQKYRLAKLFGCVRVVWNDSLACCQEKYKIGEKKPVNSELQKQFITSAKKTEYREWLSEVSNIPLQQSLNDLNQAYQNFFKSTRGQRKGKPIKPPQFKRRKSRQTARFTKGGFKVGQHKVYLAKIGKLKIVWSRELPGSPSSVTVIKDSANRYFLSFVVEIQPEILPQTDNSVGIDLGIKTFATFSDGTKVDAPKPLKKRIKKLRKLSKSLSHKTKGSKRYEKARIRVAKFHAKLKDTRTDFLHKLSTEIIRENQTIVLEDLNVSGMVKNRKLSRAISDLGWRTFRTFLEGKAEKYGRDFRVISRWEPTSQICSNCGFKGGKLDLQVREWECLNCGAKHDRDENAAINILVAGGQSETLNGRGGKRKTTAKVAAACERSTRRGATAR